MVGEGGCHVEGWWCVHVTFLSNSVFLRTFLRLWSFFKSTTDGGVMSRAALFYWMKVVPFPAELNPSLGWWSVGGGCCCPNDDDFYMHTIGKSRSTKCNFPFVCRRYFERPVLVVWCLFFSAVAHVEKAQQIRFVRRKN